MTKRPKLVCLFALLFAAMLGRKSISAEPPQPAFEVWATSDLVRVFEDGFARPDAQTIFRTGKCGTGK